MQLREDCENGPDFSIILVWHEDRFSRNDPLDYGYWLKPIRDSGVILETPTGRVDWESLGGRLLSLIGQEMRHDYLRQLSRNVCRGQLAATKNGHDGTGGRSPAGYKHKGDEVLVDQQWGAIVLRIFEEYDRTSASIRSVVDLLNRDGILTTRGNKWSMATVRAVLVNRKYCGDYVRFKVRTGKYHAIQIGEIVPRRKTDSREVETEPVVVENHHKVIVPRKLFDRVQAKLGRQQKRTAHRTGQQYIFSGLLRCGDCGGPLGGKAFATQKKPYLVYQCRRFHSRGRSACYCNTISEALLVKTVVYKMQTEVLSDEAIDRLVDAYRRRLSARRRVVPANDGGQVRKQIEKLDRQIDQAVNRVLSAPENLVATIYAKIEKLRQNRDRL